MLDEHEVRLLLFTHPVDEAFLELHVLGGVVLRKRRIGDYDVVFPQLTVVQQFGIQQRVALLDIGVLDPVEDHVHLAHLVSAVFQFLSVDRKIAGRAVTGLHIVAHIDEQTARADRGVADFRVARRLEDLPHQLDDLTRRVELAALLSGALGEVFDQILVSGPQQVGKFEIVVGEPDAVEIPDHLGKHLIREDLFSLGIDRIELGGAEHTVQDGGIVFLQLLQSDRQGIAHALCQGQKSAPLQILFGGAFLFEVKISCLRFQPGLRKMLIRIGKGTLILLAVFLRERLDIPPGADRHIKFIDARVVDLDLRLQLFFLEVGIILTQFFEIIFLRDQKLVVDPFQKNHRDDVVFIFGRIQPRSA